MEAQHLVTITSQASPLWMISINGAPVQPILVLLCSSNPSEEYLRLWFLFGLPFLSQKGGAVPRYFCTEAWCSEPTWAQISPVLDKI